MPHYGAVSRIILIRALRRAGFEGPFAGGRHEYMELGEHKVRIPNPHRGDISIGLLSEVLRQAGISREEWENL